MIQFLVSLLFLAQATAAPPQNVSPPAPSQTAVPAKPVVQPSPDPASTHFTTESGIVLVAIKAASTGDYETAIKTLQGAMAKATDSTKVAAAKGWRVFKSTENDAKGNTLYIHVMLPAVQGFDYRPSLLIDELIKELAPEVLSKYQDAFAMPPTRLSLIELANMSVAPVMVTPPEAKKPGGR